MVTRWLSDTDICDNKYRALGILYEDRFKKSPVWECPKEVVLTPHSADTPDLFCYDEVQDNYCYRALNNDPSFIGIHKWTLTLRNEVAYAYEPERNQTITLII